ncbi:hypothetical protein BG005_007537 [Podila minutissima]|nr:hypothetical protein BG005_007537 [Podila minutissima]
MVRSTVRYRDGRESAKSWLCSPNLETLCYNLSRTSSSYDDEFHEMVLDIKAATVAAATGKNHYALGHGAHADELEEDMERYRGLIPGKKLHSLETDINIRDEDLGFLVDNMDTLRKLCLPKLPLGTATIGALGRHHRTIVELDLQCGSTNGTRALVKTVMNLAQLEDLALDLVDVEAFVQSGPWACLGLKRLAIAFQTLAPSDVATKIASESSRAIWQRLSCLTKLDHLTTYKGYFWSDRFQPFFTLECGLGLLSALTELRRVEADLNVLASPEAEWMIRTWPKLNLIYCERGPRDCIVDPKVVQAFKDKGIDVDTKPYFSSRSHDCRPGQ